MQLDVISARVRFWTIKEEVFRRVDEKNSHTQNIESKRVETERERERERAVLGNV